MEVVPIQQVLLIFSWTFVDLYVYNSYELYKTEEILAIYGAAVVCFIGVKILTAKHQKMHELIPKEKPKSASPPSVGGGDEEDKKERAEI